MRIEFSMIGFLAIEMSILKYSDNSLIKMNTIQALKKCIQIDFSEYTLFLNTESSIIGAVLFLLRALAAQCLRNHYCLLLNWFPFA